MENKRRCEVVSDILALAIELASEGYFGVPSLPGRRVSLDVQEKSSPRDLVTFFDKRVEDYVVSEMARTFPGEKVLGEEEVSASGRSPQELCSGQETDFWLVDPIDGTTNYSRSYPYFSTTAAFVEKRGGCFEMASACTYDPCLREFFRAGRGQGAWLGRERMRVTSVKDAQRSLSSTGFASQRAGEGRVPFELFENITKSTLGVRRDGSAALDLAYVAAGRTDAYWEWGLAPWDTAAGILLVLEAGGQLSSLDGGPIEVFSGEIVATNGNLHKWLINRIKEAGHESARH